MSEVENIPKLRFPEFNGDWVEKKLGEVVKYTKGFAFKSNDYLDSGVRIIRVSDLGPASIKKDNNIYLSAENEHLYDRWKIRKNNIVITTVGSNPDLIESAVGRGIFITNDNEGLLNQNMLKFENGTQANNRFIHCFINSPKYIHHIKKIKRGNANQANITVKELLDFKLSISAKPEQQKIAAFLAAVDNKIEQLSKKQELLGEYKKGLMQQIFSQAIRFKADDGSNFPDWNSGKLGNYGNLINGLTYSPDNIVNKGLLVLRSSNIQNGRISLNDKVYVSLEVSSEALTREDDILICVRNGSKRLIGKSTIINKNIPKSTHGAFMTVFRGESNKFISHWFQSSIYYKEVHKNLGATINSINGSDLKKFKTIFPTKPEQTKIASFLNSIDSKIKKVNKQLDESKQFKKALLQQMFV